MAIPRRDRPVPRQCERCGKDFNSYGWAIKNGGGRFCSGSCAGRQHWDQYVPEGNTYRGRYLPDHPLADAAGIVREHRLVLYEVTGPGTHPCHWCKQPVTWKSYKDGQQKGVLVVDHIDGDKRNNDPANLVPSCFGCNCGRHPKPRKAQVNAVRDDELFIVDKKRGWRYRATKKACEICGAEFLVKITVLKKNPGWGRFCSNTCSGIGRYRERASSNSNGTH